MLTLPFLTLAPLLFVASSPTAGVTPAFRSLAIGDFAELNQLFDNAKIDLSQDGPFVVKETVGFTDLELTITDLVCFDVNIGDVLLTHSLATGDGTTPSTEMQVEMQVQEIDLTCTLNYSYDYGILNGDGSVKVQTDNNGATTTLMFDALSVEAQVLQCAADIQISDMDFEGGFVSTIMDVFERLLRGVIERAVGDVACQELGSIGTTLVVGLMEKLHSRMIQPYLEIEIPSPLDLEESLTLPATALDWMDEESSVTRFLGQILPLIDVYLSSKKDGTLMVNSLLRKTFLDADTGAFILQPSQLEDFLEDSDILLETHDRLFQTTVLLREVSILGLDSITQLDTLEVIGSQTLSNSWKWSQLEVVAKVTILMAPSTLPDAILQDFTSEGIQEDISITMTVQNIDVLASILVVLDEPALAQLQLGSFLDSADILDCLWSVVNQLKLTGLAVEYEDVLPPVLSGFVSPGLDRILGDAALAALELYESSTLLDQALPAIFATTVVDLINRFIVDPLAADSTTAMCPEAPNQAGLLDYASFFQEDDGDVYGDLPPMLKSMVDEEFLSIMDTTSQRLSVNEALLEPLTRRQSGTAGRLNIAEFLWNLDSESAVAFGLESVQLAGRQVFLDHLDTVIAPAKFLQVSSGQPHLIENQVTFANGTTADSGDKEGLSVHLDGLWALTGDEALATYNELDFSMNLGGSSWIVDLLAPMMANSLLQFPVVDVFDIDCWFATLDSFSLKEFNMEIPNINLQVTCTNCTSVGLSTALPDVLTLLKDSKKLLEDRLVELGMEWARSDSTQEYLDRLVQDGKLRCPHSPAFDPLEVNSDPSDSAKSTSLAATADNAIMTMSYDGLETIAFGATMILQMAAAVLAESYSDSNVTETDPLSAQRLQDALNDPSGSSSLVDLYELNRTMVDWVGTSLDDLAEYLMAREDDGQLRINTLLRSSILDADGALEIDFTDTSIGGAEAEISLKHVRVIGLDSIDRLNVLEVLGAQTMQNQVRFENLGFEVTVSLLGADGSTKTTSEISFALGISDVTLSAALFAAFDHDLLGVIKMGSILDMKNILPCLLSGARRVEVTELAVAAGSMDQWSVTGFRDAALKESSESSAKIIMNAYADKLVAAIPAIFDETVRALINNWLSHMVTDQAKVLCTTTSFLESASRFIDLRDLLLPTAKSIQLGGSGTSPYGNLFRTVVGFIKEAIFKVDDTTGFSRINELVVAPLTRSQSNETGNLFFPGELFSGDARINVGALDTTVTVRASDAKIENLDTIRSPLNLLEATRDPYLLNNTAGMGVAIRPLHLAMRLLIAFNGDGKSSILTTGDLVIEDPFSRGSLFPISDDIQVRNEVDLSLDLSKISVMLKSMMMVSESSFFNFPLRDATDLNCWLATIPAPVLDEQGVRLDSFDPSGSLVELTASVDQLNMSLTCLECSSPKMTQLSEAISSQDGRDDLTVAVNDILNYIGALAGGNFAQTSIDRLLNNAARQCPHSPLYDADYEAATYKAFEATESEFDVSSLILLAGFAIALLVATILLVYAIRMIVRRRHKKWLGNLPPSTIRSIARTQSKERQVESDLNAATRSMFTSPVIPSLVRWGIPVVILCNIAFFLSGHLSLGATVSIQADIAGEKLKVEEFFEFSMAASTIDIWNSGGKELALMILVFSGIWPYTKQIVTLVLWFTSPAQVSVSRRGSILLWLDFWGKWSFVDVFVMVISIAAFRVSISSPNSSFLPKDFYSVEMMVVPLWGLYANMIAQLISQVSSHFIIHYHRKIVANAQPREDDIVSIAVPQTRVINLDDSTKMSYIATSVPESSVQVSTSESNDNSNRRRQALCKHQFSRPHRGETEKLVVRRGVNALYSLSVVAMVVSVIVGCSIPSFSLEFFGIVGVAVEIGQDFEAATTNQSIFSVLRLLMDEARILGTASNQVGLLSMSIVFLITVPFVPIFQVIALTRQWFFPSTPKQRARMEIVIETLGAWQYAEVYLLAVFVSSWYVAIVCHYGLLINVSHKLCVHAGNSAPSVNS